MIIKDEKYTTKHFPIAHIVYYIHAHNTNNALRLLVFLFDPTARYTYTSLSGSAVPVFAKKNHLLCI